MFHVDPLYLFLFFRCLRTFGRLLFFFIFLCQTVVSLVSLIPLLSIFHFHTQDSSSFGFL